MVSDEPIQQAAKVIDGILSSDPQVAREMFGDEPDKIARALAEADLLAPVMTRETFLEHYMSVISETVGPVRVLWLHRVWADKLWKRIFDTKQQTHG